MIRFLFALLLFFSTLGTATAQTPEATPPLHTKASLGFAGYDENGAAKILVDIEIEKGWKTYWRMPGDAGLAPAFDWKGSENFLKAEVFYPAPHRFTAFDLDNIGYKDHVAFPVLVTRADTAANLDLTLKLDLLVCSDICIPETHQLRAAIDTSSKEDPKSFAAAMTKVPQKANDASALAFQKAYLDVDAENITYLVVEAMGSRTPSDADLFVEHPSSSLFGRPATDYDTSSRTVTFRAPVHSNESLADITKSLLSSDLKLTYVPSDPTQAIEVDLPLTDKNIEPKLQEIKARAELDLRMIILAFLGGLILNLMPCVLPVLSLKVLSVVSHGGSDGSKKHRREILLNFMASAAGIISSFWLMALVVVGLKTAGNTVGWGIQFQHPWFLLFLIGVLLLFSFNLWGLFEIPLPKFIARSRAARGHPAGEPTALGHFMTGAFATLLATPCTAPFLGTAVGFALAGGVADIFTIFTFLGLGLAFPYLLLGLSPRLFKLLPRPGKWMLHLKKAMALILFLTAIWLLSVLVTITTQATLDKGWEVFSEAKIAPAVAEGKTVMVDVTADWCLTCKANKRLVLQQHEVLEALSQDNILRLQADWTKRDEDIATYLRKYGRYGIPFNIVYGPAAPEGIPLPELLSKKIVMDALSAAAGE